MCKNIRSPRSSVTFTNHSIHQLFHFNIRVKVVAFPLKSIPATFSLDFNISQQTCFLLNLVWNTPGEISWLTVGRGGDWPVSTDQYCAAYSGSIWPHQAPPPPPPTVSWLQSAQLTNQRPVSCHVTLCGPMRAGSDSQLGCCHCLELTPTEQVSAGEREEFWHLNWEAARSGASSEWW